MTVDGPMHVIASNINQGGPLAVALSRSTCVESPSLSGEISPTRQRQQIDSVMLSLSQV